KIGLAQRKGRHHHVGEEVDDQIETLSAPARQHAGHSDAAGERAINAIDDERNAEPEEHRSPIAAPPANDRKKREGGPGCSEQMDNGGAPARVHAASAADNGWE